MSALRRSLPLIAVVLLFLSGGAPRADGKPPVDPAALKTWWASASRMYLGDTVYKAKGVSFEDGVCKANFEDGVFVPVWSGQAPVSERVVGAVFVGKGSLEMRVPMRGDAMAFGAHMVRQGSAKADLAPIANQERPYTTTITRALLLSADEKVSKLLYNLEPLGSGVKMAETEEGIDEVYIVNSERGKLKADMIATNVLPMRRRLLELAGMDVVAMVRQDRLLNEELGVAAQNLRLLADFRTDDRFGVAALDGGTFGPEDYDQWLTCFRDGIGQSDTGFQSVAFAHGVDTDGIYHHTRFSGEPFPRTAGVALEPAQWMKPTSADVSVEVLPTAFSSTQKVEVKSTLTLEARGGPIQSVVLRMPTAGAVADTWELTRLALTDGTPLAWTSLNADRKGLTTAPRKGGNVATSADEALPEGVTAVDGSTSTAASVSSQVNQITSTESVNLAEQRVSQFNVADVEADLVQKTAVRYDVIVLLPQPVPEGQTVQLQLDWKATWPYANWSNAGRPLGPTTGLQEVLPDLVPALGGTAWDFTARVTLPTGGLRGLGVAVSGDTVSDVTNDEDGWRTVVARGTAARHPAVAIGKWNELEEPATKGMPAVRVSLFVPESVYLSSFPPEIRRVVSFLDRFLPDFPLAEIEAFQGRDTFTGSVLNSGRPTAAYGLISVQQVTSGSVGGTSAVEAEDAHYTQTQIARQVAGQMWGQTVAPATARDTWIADALSDLYAAMYVRAAFGPEAYDARVGAVRAGLVDPVERAYNFKQVARADRPMSLTGSAYSDISDKVLADYGFFVLAESLRSEIGDKAFFKALDRLAKRSSGQRITTEQLQEAFEETSEMDLSGFFDYWIHGGLAPKVSAVVRVQDGVVDGVLCSSVPFGAISVPVMVSDKGDRQVVANVPVVDGQGAFKVDGRQGKVKVEIDPDGLLVLYGRDVKVVSETPRCAEGG